MSQKKYKTKFPVSRIKKIMQTDEEVGKMTANTPVLISAALELFIKSITLKACEEAKKRKASRISLAHLKKAIITTDQFDFLKDLVADVPDLNDNEGESDNATKPEKDGRGRKSKAYKEALKQAQLQVDALEQSRNEGSINNPQAYGTENTNTSDQPRKLLPANPETVPFPHNQASFKTSSITNPQTILPPLNDQINKENGNAQS